jgi:hypothetical protein
MAPRKKAEPRNKVDAQESKVSENTAKQDETVKSVESRPQGRPSTFSQEIADEICARLAQGEPLAHICRDDHMPAVRTVSHWKEANDVFKANFARAREDGFDQIAAECLEIADDTSDDTLYGERGPHANTEWISRSRLRIETRLKLLAKWDPRRYGEKLAIGGAADLPPVQTETALDVAGLPTEVLTAIMKAKDAAEPS